MGKIRIEIKLGNAEMQDEYDVADLLERTADRVRQLGDVKELDNKLFDLNGNSVGTIKYVR